MPALFYEDASPGALAQEMAAGWPSAALASDEGAACKSARGGCRRMPPRCAISDCSTGPGTATASSESRTTAKSFTVTGRRLSCSLMMQHIVLCQLLGAAGRSGARHRISRSFPPGSGRSHLRTMGTRDYRECTLDGPALSNWDATVTRLVVASVARRPQDDGRSYPPAGRSLRPRASVAG